MIPLFVYGTLRPGHSLYKLIEPVVSRSVTGMAVGKLYHVMGGTDASPVYPVANFDVKNTRDNWVHGTVLWVDPESEEFQYVDHMECSAGYTPQNVYVYLAGKELNEGEDDSGYALSYQYNGIRGPRIYSGDWADVCTTTLSY